MESTTSPDYTDKPIPAETVAAIINNAVQTNDSLAATLSQPQLVALSDQTEIQELRSQDMEISNPNSKTNNITIKEEDKDDSENTLMPKQVNSLPPTESTELSQIVPRMVQHTETIFTGVIHTRGEELHSILTPNQPIHHDGSEDLSH